MHTENTFTLSLNNRLNQLCFVRIIGPSNMPNQNALHLQLFLEPHPIFQPFPTPPLFALALWLIESPLQFLYSCSNLEDKGRVLLALFYFLISHPFLHSSQNIESFLLKIHCWDPQVLVEYTRYCQSKPSLPSLSRQRVEPSSSSLSSLNSRRTSR